MERLESGFGGQYGIWITLFVNSGLLYGCHKPILCDEPILINLIKFYLTYHGINNQK
jgi:hypothetical protein